MSIKNERSDKEGDFSKQDRYSIKLKYFTTKLHVEENETYKTHEK